LHIREFLTAFIAAIVPAVLNIQGLDMSNILIVNGAKTFAHSNGELNDTLTDLAASVLADLGHQVKISRADSNYDAKDEVQNFLWADAVIYQMPGWWMGAPWTVKKYIDDVFTEGHGSLYASDGRSRSDASKKYGSGGLIQHKKYMLSLTWNAPMAAFNEPDQFFHGAGVDGVYLPFHKANQFLGLQALPTFIANDVIKAPAVEAYKAQYREHLIQAFA
jgi:modulator of drug activity B